MNRPVYLGVMGGPKVGKTHFATTLFTSKRVAPNRILYLDNHGSTSTFDLPQYTVREPWGVRHLSPDAPDAMYELLLKLRVDYFSKKKYPYDAIVLDDWSEFAQGDVDDRMDEDDSEKHIPLTWRKHGDVMRSAGRLLHPTVTHAHHLAVFQATQAPDPLEARPKRVEGGVLKFAADTRQTRIRPFLQGAFASWFPYKLDAVFYQYMEVKADKYKFYIQLVPTLKVDVLSRWLHKWVENPKLPSELLNPTFDKLLDLIDTIELKEETNGEQGTS